MKLLKRWFPYIDEYAWSDMRAMLRNARTPHRVSTATLEGRTAVITGATSGVGLAAAQELARAGCRLILVARNGDKLRQVISRLEADRGCRSEYLVVDFSRLPEVRRVGRELASRENPIDIVIHSAGMHSTRKFVTDEGFELVFCVNHLAPFVLTWQLLPKLKQQGRARIIYVSSQGHRFNGLDVRDLNWERRRYAGLRGYGASKSAQLLTMHEFADRLAGTGVTINAMHPGAVKSGIGSGNGRIYQWYNTYFVQPFLKDPLISGQAIHYLAADQAMEGVSGKYFNLTHEEKPAPHALDRRVGAHIWDLSLKLTGLNHEP